MTGTAPRVGSLRVGLRERRREREAIALDEAARGRDDRRIRRPIQIEAARIVARAHAEAGEARRRDVGRLNEQRRAAVGIVGVDQERDLGFGEDRVAARA
jgi:hypothetical protein